MLVPQRLRQILKQVTCITACLRNVSNGDSSRTKANGDPLHDEVSKRISSNGGSSKPNENGDTTKELRQQQWQEQVQSHHQTKKFRF